MLEDIKSEEFTVLKGTSLEIEANEQRHTVQVIEVRPYEPHSERPQPPFSVVLLAGRALLLPQGIYRLTSALDNQELGMAIVFTVMVTL